MRRRRILALLLLLSAFSVILYAVRLKVRRVRAPRGRQKPLRSLPTSRTEIVAFSGVKFTVSVLNRFDYATRPCNNCLRNYFTTPRPPTRNQYRKGVAVYIHHQKAGGTTMRKCLRDLLGSPDRLLTQTGTDIRGSRLLGSVHTDSRLYWQCKLTRAQSLTYSFIEGPNTMGMCDDVTEKAWPCSYFIVLRDPVARIVSSYFYCKREPDDMLCASPQLDARNASLREWAVHQRSFLLVQLAFNVRYCNLSRVDQWAKEPCWFRQRALMERDAFRLNEFARFIVDDLSNRFAVIGLLEHFAESLEMMTEVYGIDFVACAKKGGKRGDSRLGRDRNALRIDKRTKARSHRTRKPQIRPSVIR